MAQGVIMMNKRSKKLPRHFMGLLVLYILVGLIYITIKNL